MSTKNTRKHLTSSTLLLSSGLLHPGYPIMGQLNVVPQLIDEKTIRSSGNWDVFHVLGHNQQRHQWQFPPHSTEADCNLWSVFLHEVVLNIPRARAHPNLKPESRKERIKMHMDRGAPLRKWSSWTALETYLQVLSRSGAGGHGATQSCDMLMTPAVRNSFPCPMALPALDAGV